MVSRLPPARRAAPRIQSEELAELDERGGGGAAAQAWLAGLLVVGLWLLARSAPLSSARVILESRWSLWIPLTGLAIWRWGWAALHWTRAFIYRYVVYPRLSERGRRAMRERGPVPEIAIVLATYRERPDVTERVVASLGAALARLQGLARPPLLIAVTGCDEDDAVTRRTFRKRVLSANPGAELVLLRGANGKRDALALGLERLTRWGPHPDGVFVMMDGDTEFDPATLEGVMPLFRLEPPVSAVTTNEHAHVQGPDWFAEWIHLRHGQRHLYNCSISLSQRLLCLTGRCSVFRANCLDAEFVRAVRSDTVHHWLWGRYSLLSGDDKSTWFHLLSRGKRLLYAPDVSVMTHEKVDARPWLRAYHNLRRWGGNMVRNSERAIRVGPRRLGLFCWWCLVDQRISMWTVLVGPTAMLFALFERQFVAVSGYAVWLLLSRTWRSVPAWIHGRRISAYYTLCAVVFDWLGAAIKIWVSFFPARQFWHNRGARELDSTKGLRRTRQRRGVAAMMLCSIVSVYVVCIGDLVGSTRFFRDLHFLSRDLSHRPVALAIGIASLCLAAFFLARVADGGEPAPEARSR